MSLIKYAKSLDSMLIHEYEVNGLHPKLLSIMLLKVRSSKPLIASFKCSSSFCHKAGDEPIFGMLALQCGIILPNEY